MQTINLATLTSAIIALGIGAAAAQTGTLAQVKARGSLNCGTSGTAPGFSLPDAQGNYGGLDVDLCRAVAAGVFNDPLKVKFVPLSSKDRFTALQSGGVDVLVQTSTWTLSRDTALGLNFAAINYYDGQGFLVHKRLGIDSAAKLAGASICVTQGTTTELNLADYFRVNNMKYEVVAFGATDETVKAYESGRCDAYTTDASGLYSQRLKLAAVSDHIVLPEIISKEPLGPVVRHGDDNWLDIVKWTHFAMVNAEELGVSKSNVDEMLKSQNPEIKRLLGTEGKYGEAIGLTNDWAYRIIKLVGNYGEVFEKNVGQGSLLKIARGQNALWTKGGLQYAPPIR